MCNESRIKLSHNVVFMHYTNDCYAAPLSCKVGTLLWCHPRSMFFCRIDCLTNNSISPTLSHRTKNNSYLLVKSSNSPHSIKCGDRITKIIGRGSGHRKWFQSRDVTMSSSDNIYHANTIIIAHWTRDVLQLSSLLSDNPKFCFSESCLSTVFQRPVWHR